MTTDPTSPAGRIAASKNIRFYLTAAQPCPYLDGRRERKVFAALDGQDATELNDSLTHAGFRRSQNIAYRPACDMCAACVSVRVPAEQFVFTKRWRRVLNRNRDVISNIAHSHATYEQFSLLQTYLQHRHFGAGMSDMSVFDYAAMVEETSVRTHMIEYRVTNEGDRLIGCALIDTLADGLSMVYAFFDPREANRSLGSFMILDHLRQARNIGLAYVYLGYWVRGSQKMAYKTDFRPIEALGSSGWSNLDDLLAKI
ncbi:arginyltransferase [Candidatus Phycosocius spiralis]|uniref:Aspartate/glutamate leucyltransferase n=1 Tax=Candidatus Phycosocius spiralis TaxID=2815099 RepID=A0ABQ4PS91_9PROT|nr:arginyltransferase [Candidatus Phycosocius spiralis]GIU65878.1 putative arginyl-tRNA--protein transferase [Candidatus Phycosocius spiralis]